MTTSTLTVRPAAIVGNGLSRKSIDLKEIKIPTFGCNRIVDEFHPTYVVAIDDPMIQYLRTTSYPQHRILTPPHAERWEPSALHPPGAKIRSNAGMNACMEAMKRGYYKLYCLGFDFLIMNDEAKAGNVFEGQPGYENRATPSEASRRIHYFNFIAKNNADVVFFTVFPEEAFAQGIQKVQAPNVIPIKLAEFRRLEDK